MVEGQRQVIRGGPLSERRTRRTRASRFAYVPVFFFLASVCVAVVAGLNGSFGRLPFPAAALALLEPISPTPFLAEVPEVVATANAATPTPGASATPTGAPTASLTASMVPSSTPPPSATATPRPATRFVAASVEGRADCSRTAVFGLVHDGISPLDGVRVRVWWPDAPPDQLWSAPTGSDSTLGPGRYAVTLDATPRAGWWLVAVVDADGTLLSDTTAVETTESGCEDGTGRQTVQVNFQRVEGTLGTPRVAWTPTVTVTPLPVEVASPTPLPTEMPVPPNTATPLPTPDGTERTVKVPILMYHYISEPPPGSDRIRRDLSVAPDLFRAQLVTLREQGYTSITLAQLLVALQQGAPLPEKPIVLTFDDGHRDNYTNAFPILREEGFVGTFFLITNLVEERNVNYMTWEQIVEMREAGMEFGSHTMSHDTLPGQNATEVWQELIISRAILEQRLGQEVHALAYPSGKFDAGVAHLAHEAGYWIGVSTKQGVTHSTGNILTLRRVRVRGGMFPPTLIERLHYWMDEAESEP